MKFFSKSNKLLLNILLLIDNILKLVSFICDILSCTIHKLSNIGHNSS